MHSFTKHALRRRVAIAKIQNLHSHIPPSGPCCSGMDTEGGVRMVMRLWLDRALAELVRTIVRCLSAPRARRAVEAAGARAVVLYDHRQRARDYVGGVR